MKKISIKENNFKIPPVKPFENFKWRWAVTTPSESVNSPDVLLGVLKVLYKHNGKSYATKEFKNDLLVLQNSINTPLDIAKMNRTIEKNIVENLPGYWKGLGLLTIDKRIINVTALGVLIAKGEKSKSDFIKFLYKNFKLPNENIEPTTTIKEWLDNKIEIFPIKLIFDILFTIKTHLTSPSSWYLTPEELKDIIIPLSVYPNLSLSIYVKQIITYRSNPSEFKNWPNCTPGDNDFRMVKEYLLFLSNFGFLDFIELKDKSKRYYLNKNSIELIKNNDLINENVTHFTSKELDLFNISNFKKATENSGLIYSEQLITRYVSSLVTKPFVLLTGLSGSGKTKLAQSFAQWICESKEQYCIVPVGADWTNREPLLGYVNALEQTEYILPENGALELIINANKEENKNKPYFLILDEMNLSHVERYFADFLSVMESKDKFKLHSSDSPLKGNNDIPVNKEYAWPKNLFVVGTVNIDETTYMFSPKVLDRANVIEFRVDKKDIDTYLNNPKEVKELNAEENNMAESLVSIAKEKTTSNSDELKTTLTNFFKELQKVGAEFGYRTASEIQTLFGQIDVINPKFEKSEDYNRYSSKNNYKIDIAIMQKLLPKLHGSRSKLQKVLKALGNLCYDGDVEKDYFENENELNFSKSTYPLSLEKITRMYKNVVQNGFTSYAEA